MFQYDPAQDDKPETPGETPDPQAGGLGGQRPLGLVLLPETPPPPLPIVPPPIAKKRMTVTPPPVPPRLDAEEVTIQYSAQLITRA